MRRSMNAKRRFKASRRNKKNRKTKPLYREDLPPQNQNRTPPPHPNPTQLQPTTQQNHKKHPPPTPPPHQKPNTHPGKSFKERIQRRGIKGKASNQKQMLQKLVERAKMWTHDLHTTPPHSIRNMRREGRARMVDLNELPSKAIRGQQEAKMQKPALARPEIVNVR